MTQEYLYIAGTTDGPVKIGVSTAPRKRLGSLRTSSASDIQLLACFAVEGPRSVALEQAAHKAAECYRVSREWFQFSAGDAKALIEEVSLSAGIPIMPATFDSAPVGRPSSGKVRVTMLLKPETVEKFKATGKGWQARMSDVLDKNAP